jgi:hypothetical protein
MSNTILITNKLNKLRLAILGPKLYEKCSSYYVDQKDIRDHLIEMQNSPEYLDRLQEIMRLKCTNPNSSACIADALIQACNFKTKQVEKQRCFDVQLCFQRDFYLQNQNNLYCNIYRLRCSDPYHRAILPYFQRLETEQEHFFVDFLSLNSYGCSVNEYIYYIAFNSETETLCGVSLTEVYNGQVKVHFLTSRAASLSLTSVEQSKYKGVGSSLIKAIIEDYQDDANVFGIQLLAVSDAIPFYKRMGFKFVDSNMNNVDQQEYDDNHKMIYLFDPAEQDPFNTESFLKDSVRTQLYLRAMLLEDPEIVQDSLMQAFKSTGIHLQPEYINDIIKISHYAIKYFLDDLNLDQADKNQYILGWPLISTRNKRYYQSFEALQILYQNKLITIDDVMNIFDDVQMFDKLVKEQLDYTQIETYLYVIDILEATNNLENMLKKFYGSTLIFLRQHLSNQMKQQLDIVMSEIILNQPIKIPIDDDIILALDSFIQQVPGGFHIQNPIIIRLYNTGRIIKFNMTDMLIRYLDYEENLQHAITSLYLYVVLQPNDIQYLFNFYGNFFVLIQQLNKLNNQRKNISVPLNKLLPETLKRLIVKKVIKLNSCYVAEMLLKSPYDFSKYSEALTTVCTTPIVYLYDKK